MKKLLQYVIAAAFVFAPVLVQAQQEVTIRDLNTYDSPLTEFMDIEDHPLFDKEVKFTAVIVSNPKSSGLATPADNNADGVIDYIGRVHVYVADTAAVAEGREGMYMQLVSTNYEILEDRFPGDIIEVTGKLDFFNAVSQFNSSNIEHLGSVNDAEFSHLAELLEPWEAEISEIMIDNGDGTFQINLDNYTKYANAYLLFKDVTVSNVATGNNRVNWAINKDGYRTYAYDTSLRYRNDRTLGYLPGWNYRRFGSLGNGEDGEYEAPLPGSVANVSGFMILNNFNNDNFMPEGQVAFKFVPFEDGVLWVQDGSGNDVRCVSGEECLGDPGFTWRNDVEILGAPPTIANVIFPDSTVTTTEVVEIKADVSSDFSGIDEVEVVYTDVNGEQRIPMTPSGNTYSATMPSFPNLTMVSFHIEASDTDGLKIRNPLNGSYSYFVADGPVSSIVFFQKTADEKAGPSPLLGNGVMETEITGLIVSDNNDGVIILQEAAEKWSGIFLEKTDDTKALVRGDEITVTKAEAAEGTVANNAGIGLTMLINLEFDINSSGNDISDVIPVVTTDKVVELTDSGELEPYEGMLVKFENVQLETRENFGEYILRNTDATKPGGVIFNEDIGSPEVGDVDIPDYIHKTLRDDVVINAMGIVAASFGAPKVHPRSVEDLWSDDTANLFTPLLDFALFEPADNDVVPVDDHITASWATSRDLDGDAVTYEFVLYSADTTQVLAVFPSNDNSKDTEVTLRYNELDAFLENQGLENGDSKAFLWNVRVSDGLDTLDVHGPYGGYGDDFFPLYRTVTLERAPTTGIAEETGTPREFSLNQNYPNPFNPTTNISFALPKDAKVTLEVYDMLGRKVMTLVNDKQMTAGVHNVTFDASQFASGMYLYRINAGTHTSIRKMMLIK